MQPLLLSPPLTPLYDTPTGRELWLAYIQGGKFLSRVEQVVDGDSLRCRIDGGFGQALWVVRLALAVPGTAELTHHPTDPGVLDTLKALCPPGTALALQPLAYPAGSAAPTPCALTFVRPDALWPDQTVAAGWENQVVQLYGDYCRKLTRGAWAQAPARLAVSRSEW
jgi:hypothetical protein